MVSPNCLLLKDQGSEVLGDVVRITVLNAVRLPAEEVPLRVFAETIDAIKVNMPFRAGLDLSAANRRKRNFGRGVPDLVFLINVSRGPPAGAPIVIVALVIKVNRQVNPVSSRGDLEFPVVIDVLPVRADEHLHYIAIPKFEVGF